MAKKTIIQQLENVVNNVDENKESVIVIHFDWETNHLALCAAGDKVHLVAMVASALQEDPKENPITNALLTGFATADHIDEGRIMQLVTDMHNRKKSLSNDHPE